MLEKYEWLVLWGVNVLLRSYFIGGIIILGKLFKNNKGIILVVNL